MAFIPLPNGMSLCFDFTTAGQNWQFCFNIRKSAGAPTDTDLNNLADAGADWWDNHFKAQMTDETTLRQVRATDMTLQGGPQAIVTANSAGTSTGGLIGLNSPLVVSQRTAKRGRSYRGRAYISGIQAASLVDAVTVGAATVTAWGTAFGALMTELDALGFDMVVASRSHNGTPTNPAELNEVIAFVIDQKLDSQRRRLAGRGT